MRALKNYLSFDPHSAMVKEEEAMAGESEIRDFALDNPSEEDGDDVMEDLSEEDDDDDDEEAMQKVRDGFIVDDDEEEVERKRRKKHKRRKERVDDDDALDADDLELLLENLGERSRKQLKFRRLKRAQGGDDDGNRLAATLKLSGLFSDDEGEEGGDQGIEDNRNMIDEFEDFIEEDEFSDDDERKRAKVARVKKPKKLSLDTSKLSNVDRESLQQLFEVFGNGAEYEWALDAQEMEDENREAASGEPTTLDEVFEHLELKERMLTEEDNLVRIIDIPERYQKYRANLNYIDLDQDVLDREKSWVAEIMYMEKLGMFTGDLEVHFKNAVGKVVEFVSKDAYEVPFIWTHRRDFLLHSEETIGADGNPTTEVHKLLFEDDLWRIVQLDIEYHSLYEKRLNVEKLISQIPEAIEDDDILRDIGSLESMSAIQDVNDYVQFTYADALKEAHPQKKGAKPQLYHRLKANILYDAIAAFGLTAKQFGDNIHDQSSKGFQAAYRVHATDDPLESPADLLERLVDDDEVLFKDVATARDAVRRVYAEEIAHNPKVRAEVRQTFKKFANISVAITEKGRTTIDVHLPYADMKYAINRTPADLVKDPLYFLRMLEAERQGLLVIKVQTKDYDLWFRCIFDCLKLDGMSEVADLWNQERQIVLERAFSKLCSMVALSTKEDLRRECERLIALELRRKFLYRVDQAPYTPQGYDKGTKPNVLVLTFGKGDPDLAVVGVFIKENGKVDEFFKLDVNPIHNRENQDAFNGQLKEFFDRNLDYVKPDVVVISGFNANTKKLFDVIRQFVEEHNISVPLPEVADAMEGAPTSAPLPVVFGQDETARLYQNSERAKQEFPDKLMLVRYAVGVARYAQNPLLEYVSLEDDILSLNFHSYQKLLDPDTVIEAIELVFVDIVNMVGVEINEAARNPYVAKLLPYIAGLGPRKALGLIRNINSSKIGLSLANRADLIEFDLMPANIFVNCSSFLNIPYEDAATASRDLLVELLDATRIHPEDYDLARKMAADALDLDEVDIAAVEKDGGIIYQLIIQGVNKVDDLNLIDYGKELELKRGKKKYATLQIIKEELVNNFQEIRRNFRVLDNLDVFQMLTGETPETFSRGLIVPVTVIKVLKNYRDYNHPKVRWAKVITSSSIIGNIEENHIPVGKDLNQQEVVQAVVMDIYYDLFTATFSLLDEDLKKALTPKFPMERGKWDLDAQEEDIRKRDAKERALLAKTKNISHPLYHNFNFRQAEEFLAPQLVGDCVIRPSLRGSQFFTVTWKVANNLFQHLLVEEKQAPDGLRVYVVDGKLYHDIDQLIFQHIQAIAKKVSEMTRNLKFKEGTLAEVNEWLELYTKANPRLSQYVFCYDHKAPGLFLLLFKVNATTPTLTWRVRTEVEGFNLKGFSYPNMLSLCNGFKQTFKSFVAKQKNVNYGY